MVLTVVATFSRASQHFNDLLILLPTYICCFCKLLFLVFLDFICLYLSFPPYPLVFFLYYSDAFPQTLLSPWNQYIFLFYVCNKCQHLYFVWTLLYWRCISKWMLTEFTTDVLLYMYTLLCVADISHVQALYSMCEG